MDVNVTSSQMTLPLPVFGSIFSRSVTLNRSGTYLTYDGPVGVTALLLNSELPGRFDGTVDANLMNLDVRFEVNGLCTIRGTITGSRVRP